MPRRSAEYDPPHYGEPRDRDYGTAKDAGYRGGGYLGGDWAGGQPYPQPFRGQSGSLWGPPDPGFIPRDRGAMPPPSFRGRGPRNYRRSDERIREDVNQLLTDAADVDASDLTVRVEDGVVTLDGTVADRRTKRRTEILAESVRGVEDVMNRIRITAERPSA
ncbi:MAG: BON domain-containing protein [Thermoanaerobaculia bacterium]